MRITTNAFYSSATTAVSQQQRQLGELTVAMSSGKRVRRPSDDPAASLTISRAYGELGACASRQRLLQTGQRTCRATDAALGQIVDSMTTSVEAAMQATQSACTDTAQRAAAAEIRSAMQSMVTTANTKASDRYLFGGFQDRVPPFEETAGSVTYVGDSGEITVPVGNGRSCPAGIPGDRVFNVDSGAGRALPIVDRDVFEVLSDLAGALEAGDTEAARAHTDDLQLLRDNVLQMRGEMGAAEMRIDTNCSAIADTALRCQELIEQEESIDLAEALTDYTAAETAYQSLLGVLSRIMSMPTMFDLTR